MRFKRATATEERLKRLARSIESLAGRDAAQIREAERMSALRGSAAAELHAICADFVGSVNRLLSKPLVELGPAEFQPASFRDPGNNVFQINFSGRMLHMEFRATDTLTSTDDFRIPYIIEGKIRCLNQQMLDQVLIPETLLFCCLESGGYTWLTFDPRIHRVTPFDREFLVVVMERLV